METPTHKHTPGPWNHSEKSDYHRDEIQAANGQTLALVWVRSCAPGLTPGIGNMRPNPEGVANARLIAAAPELFEIVGHLLRQARHYGPTNRNELGGQYAVDTIEKAETLIAKVTQS